jgi:hypothetical protein
LHVRVDQVHCSYAGRAVRGWLLSNAWCSSRWQGFDRYVREDAQVPKLAAVIGRWGVIVEDRLYDDCSNGWARCGLVCRFGVYSFACIDTRAFLDRLQVTQGGVDSARVMYQWLLRLDHHFATEATN